MKLVYTLHKTAHAYTWLSSTQEKLLIEPLKFKQNLVWEMISLLNTNLSTKHKDQACNVMILIITKEQSDWFEYDLYMWMALFNVGD